MEVCLDFLLLLLQDKSEIMPALSPFGLGQFLVKVEPGLDLVQTCAWSTLYFYGDSMELIWS